MHKRRLLFQIAMCVAVFGLAATNAKANSIILNLVGGAPTADGANWKYTYNVELDPLNRVSAGDGFSVFDFDGYVAGSAILTGLQQAANWTFTYGASTLAKNAATTATVAGFPVPLTDNPGIGNLNLTYTGPGMGFNPNGTTFGVVAPVFDLTSLVLGTFSVDSTLPNPRFDSYYAQDTAAGGGSDQNVGQVQVAGLPGGFESPLPASVWGSLGLLGLLVGVRITRSRDQLA